MFQLDFASRIPIYEQIRTNIIKLASAGVFKSGDKLPPVRILATQLGINPNTVAKAYRELENDGYIYSTVGRGSYLTDKLSKDSAQKMLAYDDLKKSINNAHLFGVSKEDMFELIESAFKGGQNID